MAHSCTALEPGAFDPTCFGCIKKSEEWARITRPPATLSIRSTSTDGLLVVEAWLGDKRVGSMKLSVMPLVHDMEIAEGMLQRKVADALFQYASGYVRAKGFGEAAVLVAHENEKMKRYVGERAVAEDPAQIYLMEVK